jgi:hypothetical protein
MPETRLMKLAMSIGVAGKIAALLADCDRAIADLATQPDQRWLWRLEDQHRTLLNPSLRALAALTTRMAEENPSLSPLIAPALADLALRYPDMKGFHARALTHKVRDLHLSTAGRASTPPAMSVSDARKFPESRQTRVTTESCHVRAFASHPSPR